MFKKILLKTVRLYQKTLSPDTGWFKIYHPHGFCRYYPNCSEYSYQAIDKHGSLKGLIKTSWRIMRCNPLSKGGHDPIK
jgi:uncharacterized protein